MMGYTEQDSAYTNLENKSTEELLLGINEVDQQIAAIVQGCIPALIPLVDSIVQGIKQGGRLIYIGAGSSGRLGVLDASECPPTFGVPYSMVHGLIAGGDDAIRYAVENAEDNLEAGWTTLQQMQLHPQDVIVGISASGTTPYVHSTLAHARAFNLTTGCIVCNLQSSIAQVADFPVEMNTGPEFLTGSTRMKAGTAQKMVLNMLSTSVMIKLGKVYGNKMIDMRIANDKLRERAIRMLVQETSCSEAIATSLLSKYKSVRAVLENLKTESTS
ncbi:N-acetylmuramic acid 6-phosphate etherase [Sphingobacterium sp. SYP-B4668]|uniref:N-acetylmuramic acid 6-phosphate etherase n=1 Tax=Sphingobacterium sp. SYP-B4668 TaxID=2996035 RepID=UPI0022DD499E|nr:N-acetylmuramic acid 6-phosphate etherase [Sphingobacterium sp. SYP-B4668]